MEEVFKADVFFFITSIAVILLSALLLVILYHVLKVVKKVRGIVERIEEGSEMIVNDLAEARSTLLNTSIAAIVSGLMNGLKYKIGKVTDTGKKAKDNDEDLEEVEEVIDNQMERLIAEKKKRKRGTMIDIQVHD